MPNTRNKKNTISHPLYRNAFLLRRGDVIYTSIAYDGVRYRETTNLTWHQSNFKLAERILEAKLQALMNPQVAIENQSIEVLFNQYLDFKAKSVTSSAIKKYKQAWNNWIQFDYNTSELDLLRNDILTQIGKSKLHTNTIVKGLQLLSAFFKHLIESKIIKDNPITNSLMPKTKHKDPEQFTEIEIEKIINFYESGSDFNLLIRLIANTGMRIAEAVSLTKDNFEDGWLVFIGKGGFKRRIPINEESELYEICKIISSRPKCFIWIGPTVPHRHLRKICSQLGFANKGFHGIRRYFENVLMDEGANLKATADILGHTLQIQSKHYKTRSKPKKLQDAMNVIPKKQSHTKGTV